MEDENYNKLKPEEQAIYALDLLMTAQKTKDKLAILSEYESFFFQPSLNNYALNVFTSELLKAKSDVLKKELVNELSIHASYGTEKETGDFCLNAISIILSTAKTVKSEEIAASIYSEPRFMIGEDYEAALTYEQSMIFGTSILSNINPFMNDQSSQAHLLQCFNHASQNGGFKIPESMANSALKVLNEYYKTSVEAININSSIEQKKQCWAHHQIRTELTKIALNDSYILRLG